MLAVCCRYPGRKEENWWLLVGRPADNSCLVIKRVPLKQKQTTKLQFTAPEQTGQQELSLYFMCDSWNGCDQVRACLGLFRHISLSWNLVQLTVLDVLGDASMAGIAYKSACIGPWQVFTLTHAV